MNTPNKLTVLRMALVPVYIVLMYAFETKIPALIVYIIASVTDFLDGHIARKYNLVSDFGKFMTRWRINFLSPLLLLFSLSRV